MGDKYGKSTVIGRISADKQAKNRWPIQQFESLNPTESIKLVQSQTANYFSDLRSCLGWICGT